MNKKIKIICSIIILSLVAVAFQYINVLRSEIVNAYQAAKPANGHNWSEMQCTSDMCISNGKVGIGTDAPAQKLEVSGSILASGSGSDVCNGSGKCLSATYQTNVMIGSNPTCPAGQTMIMKAYNGTWYTYDNASISSWNKVTCGALLSADGTPILVYSTHTSKNCNDLSGTVLSDGNDLYCRFNSSACPGGWSQYKSYTKWEEKKPACIPDGYVINACSTGKGLVYPDTYYPGQDLPAIGWGNNTTISIPRTGIASFRLWSSNCYNWYPGPYSCNYTDYPVQVGCY